VRDGAAGDSHHNANADDGRMAREQTLVGQAQAGDAVAFGELFAVYHGPLTSYLYHLTGDRALADDLAQDAFLRAYRALPAAGADVLVRPWLYQIATNLARSHYRRARLLRWLPFSDATPDPPDPQAANDGVALGEREALTAALRRIGPTHASVLLLRHEQGLSLEETAAALGVNANAAKTRLFRARRAFIAAWDELEGVGEETSR
jgi:RNA polymerase sigma-70 factor (ECF subfamily)